MKLTSGKEVELRSITFKERQAARNATKVGRSNGAIIMLDAYDSQILWVRAGLDKIDGKKFYGLDEDKQDEALMKLSDSDLDEISTAIIKENTLGDVEAKK